MILPNVMFHTSLNDSDSQILICPESFFRYEIDQQKFMKCVLFVLLMFLYMCGVCLAGCAFVTFASRQCALNAIKNMHHSRTMEVR